MSHPNPSTLHPRTQAVSRPHPRTRHDAPQTPALSILAALPLLLSAREGHIRGRLKLLGLPKLEAVRAEGECAFPELQRLQTRGCPRLKRIPLRPARGQQGTVRIECVQVPAGRRRHAHRPGVRRPPRPRSRGSPAAAAAAPTLQGPPAAAAAAPNA